MLHIEKLTYRIGARALFDQADIRIPAGHRIGLIGRNGSGKSTLIRLIIGSSHPDQGEITIRRNARIGYLAQEAPSGELSPRDFVLSADKRRQTLIEALHETDDPGRLAEIHSELDFIGADKAPARAAVILAGLGFNESQQMTPLSSFSGGWRMRVALAAVLFSEPDLLLLDEPSNHLDLEAAIWLEQFLKTYPYTLLLVSHDRDLLNSVSTHILHLDQAKLTLYAGGYDVFERTRSAHLLRQQSLKVKQEAERARLEAFVTRFRAKASKAKQAQSRMKMLERMTPIAAPENDETTPILTFANPTELSPPILVLDDIIAGYAPGLPILRNLNQRIDPDDRIALLGANGNGKSTFAKILAGTLAPLSGKITRSNKLKIGYFGQHQTEEFDSSRSATQILNAAAPAMSVTAVRTLLGRFGLSQARAETKAESLSGGERARLLFALIALDKPHLLILDEPTNHLDIQSREALIAALNAYEGAVILISHDRHLLETTIDRLWLVDQGSVTSFDGDLEDYRKYLLAQRRKTTPEKPASGRRENLASKNPRTDKDIRALQKTLANYENRMERLTVEKAEIEQELGQADLYKGNTTRLAELIERQGKIADKLSELEALWLDATTAHEQASGKA